MMTIVNVEVMVMLILFVYGQLSSLDNLSYYINTFQLKYRAKSDLKGSKQNIEFLVDASILRHKFFILFDRLETLT
jgi:hypothetical protein